MNRLRQLTYEPSKHDLETQFAMGRLMSPAEVAAATRHRPHHETECYEQRWMLCGDVKAATYELFSRTPAIAIPFRVSAFTSTPGSRWGVVTHQIEGHQHRFVLPLWEPASAAFFSAMPEARHGFSLGRAGELQAVVIPGQPTGEEDIQPLLRLCTSAYRPPAEAGLGDMLMVMLTLGRADAIPSFVMGREVTDVSVSMLTSGHALTEAAPQETVH